jgi:SAM-dependent methyltransferase
MSRLERNTHITEFFDAWSVYKKAVDHDDLAHRETYATLRDFLEARFSGRGFSILDLGCGDAGFIAEALRGTGVRAYTGFDLSSTALALARRNLAGVVGEPELTQVDLVDGLRACDGRFDIVFSSYALHHLSRTEKSELLGRGRRALRDDGALVVIDVMLGESESRDEYLERFTAYLETRAEAYAPGELAALIGHVRASDFPESFATYERLARDHRMSVARAERVRGLFGFFACEVTRT